jgi:hypothetical protein
VPCVGALSREGGTGEGVSSSPVGGPGPLTVEEFIGRASPALAAQGFFEREVARREERFGRVSHVFSTYEKRRAASDAAPYARGVNSIQLVEEGGRWWILSVAWDEERPGNPLPTRYLGAYDAT